MRAAVGGSGELIVREDGGSLTTLWPNHVYGVTTGLRAALDGIDTAVNLFFAHAAASHIDVAQYQNRFISTAAMHFMAQLAATQYTQGDVTSIDASEGMLTLTFEGDATDIELEPMLTHLASALESSNFVAIQVVSPNDELLARLDRL